MESTGLGYGCEYLPTEGILVADIRDDQVPESLVCKYFGPKATKSGWKYNLLTTEAEQCAILSLYRRVYHSADIPNKEISLQFARGLIWMSSGQKVNWFQFSEERRLVRAGLKRKAEERKIKKEREADGQGFEKPSILGKKRCNADQKLIDLSFPSSLSLTVKSEMEFAAQCSNMGVIKSSGKGVGKGPGKGSLLISPTWMADEVQSMDKVIQEIEVLLKECQMSLSRRVDDAIGIESKLRRSKILLTDRKVMLEESRQQMNAFSLAGTVLRCAIEEKMSAGVNYGQSIESGGCEDSIKDRIDLEDIIVKKGMEERTLSHCDEAVQGLSLTIQGLEDQLSRSEEMKNTFSVRVLSLERSLEAMTNQLSCMRNGGGAALFPRPIAGRPSSPLVLTHTLNACPICSLWYTCFDYVPIACGHTYHLFCLWEHSKLSSRCAMPNCGESFHNDSLAALGIRPTVFTSVFSDAKKPCGKTPTIMATTPVLSGETIECLPLSPKPQSTELISPQSTKLMNKETISSQFSQTELKYKKSSKTNVVDYDAPSNCTVCRQQSATVFLERCEHKSLCFGCIEGKTKCPICDEDIDGWQLLVKTPSINPHLKTLGCAEDISADPLIASAAERKRAAKGLEPKASSVVVPDSTTHHTTEGYSNSDNEERGLQHWCANDVFRKGGIRSMSRSGEESLAYTEVDKVQVDSIDVDQALSSKCGARGVDSEVSMKVAKSRLTKKGSRGTILRKPLVDSLNHTRVVSKTMSDLLGESSGSIVPTVELKGEVVISKSKRGRPPGDSRLATLKAAQTTVIGRINVRPRNLPARLAD